MIRINSTGRGLILAGLLTLASGPATRGAATVFEVTYSAELRPEPIMGPVYVMLAPAGSFTPPRNGPNWFNPQPFFRLDAKDWKAGEPLRFESAGVAGFPDPIAGLKPGKYVAQAVIRLNPDTHRLGDGAGNAYSSVSPPFEIGVDDGAGVVSLRVDHIVPPREFKESDRVKLVDIPSPLLSAFHKRPMRQRAAVVLPEGVTPEQTEKLPTIYIIPGFGGDHFMAQGLARRGNGGYGADYLRVVLDPDCGTGHHVFADSATNGPRGEALIAELIPYIESHFPARAEPKARLLNGHSSGGWSSLWLQVTYPEFFGGVWSTSPDPVDFRDFQRIDLYKKNANVFRDEHNERRPIARRGTTPVLWYENFSRMEDVIGDGGQLHSFEAVFSPLDPDGKPRRVWDRATGAVDPEAALAWRAYDIRLVLERDWERLKPALAGKIHIYMGSLDTFYLEGATRLLGESLKKLGSDAVVELFEGKDHGSIMDAKLIERINAEMHQAINK